MDGAFPIGGVGQQCFRFLQTLLRTEGEASFGNAEQDDGSQAVRQRPFGPALQAGFDQGQRFAAVLIE